MRNQNGFSLVELMIALVLGLLIVAAAVQLFATNQRTFRLQMDMTDVQEQGRFATDYLTRNILKFGTLAPSAPGVPVTVGNSTIIEDMMVEGGAAATANDAFGYRFFGTEDCEGDISAGGELIENEIWVDEGELYCRGSVSAGTDGVAIVGGVESFQVLFGVDELKESGEPSATSYLHADEVDVDDIIATVRIGLLMRVENASAKNLGADPVNFVVLDKALQGGDAPLDEPGIRRLFVTTIKVRNYNGQKI